MYYGYIYGTDENGRVFKIFIESSTNFNGIHLTYEEYLKEKFLNESQAV